MTVPAAYDIHIDDGDIARAERMADDVERLAHAWAPIRWLASRVGEVPAWRKALLDIELSAGGVHGLHMRLRPSRRLVALAWLGRTVGRDG